MRATDTQSRVYFLLILPPSTLSSEHGRCHFGRGGVAVVKAWMFSFFFHSISRLLSHELWSILWMRSQLDKERLDAPTDFHSHSLSPPAKTSILMSGLPGTPMRVPAVQASHSPLIFLPFPLFSTGSAKPQQTTIYENVWFRNYAVVLVGINLHATLGHSKSSVEKNSALFKQKRHTPPSAVRWRHSHDFPTEPLPIITIL